MARSRAVRTRAASSSAKSSGLKSSVKPYSPSSVRLGCSPYKVINTSLRAQMSRIAKSATTPP
eukprot:5406923-Prymnesium_polylepis.1